MSDKDLELMFLNLKTVFIDFHSKIDEMIKKYEILEKQIESKKKGSFKCRFCKNKFESHKDLREHKKAEQSCGDEHKCEKCEKSYKSEKDLTLHQKMHGNFKCEKCDYEFDVPELLEKHVSAVHGKMKIFCHYFNNKKECPFEGSCIFAHDESPDCKFGKNCERIMCMFSHEERDVSDTEEDDDESENENDDDENNDEVNNDDEVIVKIGDIEPSLRKVEEAMDKVEQLLQNKTSNIKCNICDFEAKNSNGLTMHKKAKHPDTSST